MISVRTSDIVKLQEQEQQLSRHISDASSEATNTPEFKALLDQEKALQETESALIKVLNERREQVKSILLVKKEIQPSHRQPDAPQYDAHPHVANLVRSVFPIVRTDRDVEKVISRIVDAVLLSDKEYVEAEEKRSVVREKLNNNWTSRSNLIAERVALLKAARKRLEQARETFTAEQRLQEIDTQAVVSIHEACDLAPGLVIQLKELLKQ